MASGTEKTPIINKPTAIAPILGQASVIPKTTRRIPTKKAIVLLKAESLELSKKVEEGFSGVSSVDSIDTLPIERTVSKVCLK